jgi:hypothetical protein
MRDLQELTDSDAQCFLRLVPHVDCDTTSYRGLLAFSWLTFVLFVIGWPVGCLYVMWARPAGGVTLAIVIRSLDNGTRRTWWRVPWTTVGLSARRLVFIIIAGTAADFVQTVPLLNATAVIGLLLIQVRELAPQWARLLTQPWKLSLAPYAAVADNVYETALLTLLLWSTIASLIEGVGEAHSFNRAVEGAIEAFSALAVLVATCAMVRDLYRQATSRFVTAEAHSPAASSAHASGERRDTVSPSEHMASELPDASTAEEIEIGGM